MCTSCLIHHACIVHNRRQLFCPVKVSIRTNNSLQQEHNYIYLQSRVWYRSKQGWGHRLDELLQVLRTYGVLRLLWLHTTQSWCWGRLVVQPLWVRPSRMLAFPRTTARGSRSEIPRNKALNDCSTIGEVVGSRLCSMYPYRKDKVGATLLQGCAVSHTRWCQHCYQLVSTLYLGCANHVATLPSGSANPGFVTPRGLLQPSHKVVLKLLYNIYSYITVGLKPPCHMLLHTYSAILKNNPVTRMFYCPRCIHIQPI